MSEPLTDGMLVQRASRGDSIAFSELVIRHYRRSTCVAFGLLQQLQAAEDVAQEAFARLHARLGEFHGAPSFYMWLYRMVVGLSLEAARRRAREVPDAQADAAALELPTTHHAVLLLRDLEGFSYEEIAMALQIKKATVISRLFHARKAVQMRLASHAKSRKAAPEAGS